MGLFGSSKKKRATSEAPGSGSRSVTATKERPVAERKPSRAEAAQARGAAEHPDEPDTLKEVTKPSWKYTAKNTLREFSDDQCTDIAAALTYYAVLALFPALLAIVSLLGVFGQGQRTVDGVLDIIRPLAPADTVNALAPTITSLVNNQAAGITLVIGIASALWSASGYVGAFARASNRIYEIEEGRPFYKLRPMQIVVTLVAVLLICLVAISIVVSGPLAESIGNQIGLGSAAVTAFSILKWPVMAAIVVAIIAVLYWATPNIQQPKFKIITPGAVIALVVWVLASVLFFFYVSNFGSYNKTYGTLAGVIVFLLWLWITNIALLLGAEFNSEFERARQLQAGLPAEDELQLPPRDTKKIAKKEQKEEKSRQEGRRLRQTKGRSST